MGHSCVAPGCRSGYRPRRRDPPAPPPSPTHPVSMHSFPRDPILFQAWVKAIPRTHYTPTPNLKICSRHFLPSDFVTTSVDSNTTRRQKKALLAGNANLGHPVAIQRRLKPEAIPSLWLDLPAPSSTEKSKDPLGRPRRRKVATLPPKTLPEVVLPPNRVVNLMHVAERLDELAHLKDLTIVQNSDYFIFMSLSLPDPYRPNRVRYSMTLFPDLSFKLEYQNLPFSRDLVSSVTQRKRIEFVHQIGGILQILERVETQSDPKQVELARVIRDFQTNMSQFTFKKPKLWSKIQDALTHLKVEDVDEPMKKTSTPEREYM